MTQVTISPLDHRIKTSLRLSTTIMERKAAPRQSRSMTNWISKVHSGLADTLIPPIETSTVNSLTTKAILKLPSLKESMQLDMLIQLIRFKRRLTEAILSPDKLMAFTRKPNSPQDHRI